MTCGWRRMRSASLVAYSLTALVLPVPDSARAQTGNPGDLLVSITWNINATNDPDRKQVLEFTPAGGLVRTINATHPDPSGGFDWTRSVVAQSDGSFYLYFGSGPPYLSHLSSDGTTWNYWTYPEWSTASGVTYGGIGQFGNYVFLTDMNAPVNASGILRFDTLTQTFDRFLNGEDFCNLCIGHDGRLYALDPNRTNSVQVFDPMTMRLLKTVALQVPGGASHPQSMIQVNAAGEIYSASYGGAGSVCRFTPSGALLNQRSASAPYSYMGLGVSLDGRVAATVQDGSVAVMDASLKTLNQFVALGQHDQIIHTMFVSFIPGRANYDFSGDAKNDLLAQNPTNGALAVLQMNGTYLGGSYGLQPSLPPNWLIVGAGDFTGDGKPDLVAQNSQTREISILTTLQGRITSSVPVRPVLPANWRVVGAADFDQDGMPDILVQNTVTRQVSALLMNGTTIKRSAPVTPTLPAGWSVVGTADFNGDKSPDILAQNGSQMAVLIMNGTAIVSSHSITPNMLPGWVVTGVVDLDGDGKPELVAQETATNRVAIMKTDGQRILSSQTLANPLLPGWQIVGPH